MPGTMITGASPLPLGVEPTAATRESTKNSIVAVVQQVWNLFHEKDLEKPYYGALLPFYCRFLMTSVAYI